MTLDGLERELKSFRTKGKVHLTRYADDFVVTGVSKELLEHEILPIIKKFLGERGLELSQEKTRIVHIREGFDFLGQNIRKYGDGAIFIGTLLPSILLEGLITKFGKCYGTGLDVGTPTKGKLGARTGTFPTSVPGNGCLHSPVENEVLSTLRTPRSDATSRSGRMPILSTQTGANILRREINSKECPGEESLSWKRSVAYRLFDSPENRVHPEG